MCRKNKKQKNRHQNISTNERASPIPTTVEKKSTQTTSAARAIHLYKQWCSEQTVEAPTNQIRKKPTTTNRRAPPHTTRPSTTNGATPTKSKPSVANMHYNQIQKWGPSVATTQSPINQSPQYTKINHPTKKRPNPAPLPPSICIGTPQKQKQHQSQQNVAARQIKLTRDWLRSQTNLRHRRNEADARRPQQRAAISLGPQAPAF